MPNQDAAILLEFLQQTLWNEKKERLKIEALSEELRPVGEELNRLAGWIDGYMQFAQAISQGNLDVTAERENQLCWPLKELRSNLSHLTWQTQQVAKGDYQQRVVFMGEFAEGFNTMVRQLQEREQQLTQAAAMLSARADRLEEANEMINQVVNCSRDWIIVLDPKTHETLFKNRSSEQLDHLCKGCTPECLEDFNRQLYAFLAGIEHSGERQIERMCRKSLVVNSYEMEWSGRQAMLHIITDVTRQRKYDEELINYAYKDPLTNLYNRRFCTHTMKELLAAQTPFVLCFSDLDGLKQVNDQCGHPAGDLYLTTVARAFRHSFRKEDILCRIGGDEFAVILQHCGEAMTVQRMEEVRALLRKEQESVGFAMDLSYGITVVQSGETLSWGELLNQADEKMYRQKSEHKLRSPQPVPGSCESS